MSAPIWVAGVPPAPTGKTGRYERVVFIPDVHCGDQDDRAVLLALRVIKSVAPVGIVQLGDVLDFYGLSRFDHDPDRFAARVQNELDIQHALYRRIKEVSPRSWKKQILGNHEERGIKLLWKNPALSGLRALSLENLMGLDKFGWEPKVHQSLSFASGAFVARHGRYISNAPKKELFSTWLSGASGHTHRLGTYAHTAEGGEYSWTECGCLQSNPPSWRNERQDWQQGLVIAEFEVDGNGFAVTPVRFRRSYNAVVNGVEVSG